MDQITVDFSQSMGRVKPMHSVNNGPVYKFAEDQRITNIHAYREAGIPYARTHDASFYATYGGEHIVDVNMIFTNFDRDPADPDAYDFVLTDTYLRTIEAGGAKPFYRLGSKIEHWEKKYNTLPPKDFYKWAVICEHIIRHYNEGWANGFRMNIEYWEIWNEPDLDPDDSTHKRCWGGTRDQFFELFNVTLKHLKSCFPHLKIGGPACASIQPWFLPAFFDQLEMKPDFFSWHVYAATVEKVRDRIRLVRQMMDEHGLTDVESILNEWNYVRGWEGDNYLYSLRQLKSLKGSAFVAAVMLMSQSEELDHLIYYDARPSGFNGMFCTDFVCDCLKGYYPFYMFNQLYRQGTSVKSIGSDEVWVSAAKGEEQNVMLTYYTDNDQAPAKEVCVSLQNVENPSGVRVEFYCLDADHDCELIREESFTSTEFSVSLTMPLHSTFLLKIKPL